MKQHITILSTELRRCLAWRTSPGRMLTQLLRTTKRLQILTIEYEPASRLKTTTSTCLPLLNVVSRFNQQCVFRCATRSYSDQLPTDLEFTFRTYRCTSSIYQESRAKGDRSRGSGYTGCKARFTARYVNIAPEDCDSAIWRVIVESEYRTHNHPTIGAIHTRVKDIPIDSEVARTVSLLADAKASNKGIGSFLGRHLGTLSVVL